MKRLRTVLAWASVGLLVLATAAMIGWRIHGGSWVRVETPSMGTTAPVGTLLWIESVAFDDVKAGDLISFHPPGSTDTYSHLVTSVNADATLSTHGEISGPDTWRIPEDRILGRAAMVWPGVGWLLLAAPMLGFGALLVWGLVRWVRDRTMRVPLAVLGAAVVVTVAIVTYRPLLGAEQISFEAKDGAAEATYVGTGLLPVRLSTPEGDSVVLGPGQVGSVIDTNPDAIGAKSDRFTVVLGPAIGLSWWLALIFLCFLPASIETIRHLGRREHSSRLGAAGGRHVAVH